MGIPVYREREANKADSAAVKLDAAAAASRSPIRRSPIVVDDSGRRRRHNDRRRSRDLENRPQLVISDVRAPVRGRRVRTPIELRNLRHLQQPRRDEDSFDRRARNVERSLQAALDSRNLRTPGEPSGGATRERSMTRSYFMPSPPYSNTGNQNSASGDARRQSPTMPSIALTNPYAETQNNSTNDRFSSGPSYGDFLPPLTRVQGRIPSPADSYSSRHEYFPRASTLNHDRGRRSPAMSDSSSARDTWETLLTTMEPDEHLPSASSSFTSAEASANAARSTSTVRSSQTTAPIHLSPISPMHANGHRSYIFHAPCDLDESDLDSLPDLVPLDEAITINTTLHGDIWPVLSSSSGSDTETSSDSPPTYTENDFHDFEREIQRRFGIAQANSENEYAPPSSHGGRVYPPPRHVRRNLMRTDAIHNAPRHSGQSRTRYPPIHALQGRQGRSDELDQMNDLHPGRGPLAAQGQDSDVDLSTTQRLIERLARRQDIPDEWWAAAGLARSVRESQAEG